MKAQLFALMALVALSASAELQEVTKVATYKELQQAYRTGKNNILLTADIEMSTDENFNELKDFLDDNDTKNCVFKDGVFDGGGHAIKWMMYNERGFFGKDYVALFRKANGSTFKNVRMENTSIKGTDYVGAVVGFAENCKFDNIYVSGFVKGKTCIGGVAGQANHCEFTNCTANAYLNSSDPYVGGIVGIANYCNFDSCLNKQTVYCEEGRSGGIAGVAYEGTVSNCRNTAKVVGNNFYTGGIVGDARHGVVITNCVNDGAVSNFASISDDYVGGITGCLEGTIKGCVNNGAIAGDSRIGGIAGCLETGSSIPQLIVDCYSHGDVYGTDARVGGIAGKVCKMGTLTNCLHDGKVYYKNEYSGKWGSGECTGVVTKCCFVDGNESGDPTNRHVSAQDLASGMATYYLNDQVCGDSSVWRQTLKSDKMPVLCMTDDARAAHKVVYGYPQCESWRGYLFTNSSEKPYGVHNFVNGKCECGLVDGTQMVVERSGSDWGTLCMPVQLNTADAKGVNFYSPVSVSVSADGQTAQLYVEPIDSGTIVEPGTPVVYQLDKECGGHFKVHGCGSEYAYDAKTFGLGNDWEIDGTLCEWPLRPNQSLSYFVPGENQMDRISFWTTSDPFVGFLMHVSLGEPNRVQYITFTTTNPATEPSLTNSVPTDITEIDVNKGGIPDGPIYNLQGQRLSEPQHGQINIIGGKKVFVK